MSDFKSKLPDLKELTSMTGKLYKGIKSSVSEIIQDYKLKREQAEGKEQVVVEPAIMKEKEAKPFVKPSENVIPAEEKVKPVDEEPI